MRKVFLLLVISLVTVFCLLISPLVSMANVRVEWEPGIGYGGPFYARIEPGWTIHTDEWAAISFYRNPDCVPEDFNLLDFFDPNALGCESFVAGFEVWKNGPDTDDLAPIQLSLKAAGPVHVYFAPWSVMQVAIGDGILMMPELESLEGVRIGIATFYTETLHASGMEGTGGAQQYMEEIVAKGYIETDSSIQFELKLTLIHTDKDVNTKIEFKTTKSAPALRPQSNLATTWGEMKR